MGSAMPYCRRSRDILRLSCCVRHCERRASRGCADSRLSEALVVEALVGADSERLRFERRVSCTPGAEGAPSCAVVVEGCA